MSGLNINGRLRALGASPRFVIFWIQPAIFALAGIAAFLIRFELSLTPTAIEDLRWALPIWIIVKTAVFRVLKLERGSWAFVSVPDFLRVGLANLIGSAVSAIAIALLAPPGFPRSVYII